MVLLMVYNTGVFNSFYKCMFKAILNISTTVRTGWPRSAGADNVPEAKPLVLELRTGDKFELPSAMGGHGMLFMMVKIESSVAIFEPLFEARIREAEGREVDLRQDSGVRSLQLGQTIVIKSQTTDIVDVWSIILQRIEPDV